MAKWKKVSQGGAATHNGEQRTIFYANPAITAQIIREHNSHDALVGACRIGLKSFKSAIKALSTVGVADDEVVGLQDEITGRIKAALALAEGE